MHLNVIYRATIEFAGIPLKFQLLGVTRNVFEISHFGMSGNCSL